MQESHFFSTKMGGREAVDHEMGLLIVSDWAWGRLADRCFILSRVYLHQYSHLVTMDTIREYSDDDTNQQQLHQVLS